VSPGQENDFSVREAIKMKEKNFIPHTRPHGRRELEATIRGIKKQIHYWKSIGRKESIDFWSWQMIQRQRQLKERFGKKI